jgi:hypothetical protein
MTRRGAVTRHKSRHGAAMGTFVSKHEGSGLSECFSVEQDWQILSKDDRAGMTLRKLGRRTGAGGWFPLVVGFWCVWCDWCVGYMSATVPSLTYSSCCRIDESCSSRPGTAMGTEARKEQSVVTTRSHWHAISQHTQTVVTCGLFFGFLQWNPGPDHRLSVQKRISRCQPSVLGA